MRGFAGDFLASALYPFSIIMGSAFMILVACVLFLISLYGWRFVAWAAEKVLRDNGRES